MCSSKSNFLYRDHHFLCNTDKTRGSNILTQRSCCNHFAQGDFSERSERTHLYNHRSNYTKKGQRLKKGVMFASSSHCSYIKVTLAYFEPPLGWSFHHFQEHCFLHTCMCRRRLRAHHVSASLLRQLS